MAKDGDVKPLVLRLKMTREQRKSVDRFYSSRGKCICGETMPEGHRRTLLSEPFSKFAEKEVSGLERIVGLCDQCWAAIGTTIRIRKSFASR